ncbi:MAG: hypothetical protein PHH47_10715 [Gallionella sp.]|nr:hypothetical protein [Gallionella sp.]MDD4947028.1 hypothetical protein [Gallionella sp.]MDD5612611.1 hypothetical protein [Gallionella sp.]
MNLKSDQKGIALLVFVTVLITAAAAVTVKALNSNNSSQIARDKITAAALAQAKDALIGYAITYPDTHPTSPQVMGYLPCPDTAGTAEIGGEGGATGNCGTMNTNSIGRLPWKTLNITPLRGGDGECLWYAVAGTYKNNPKTGLMNWDTGGQLQVYAANGTSALTSTDNQAVAVIFAPGPVTPGQSRTGTAAPMCGGNYTVSNYLDRSNCPGASCRDNTSASGPFYTGPILDSTGNPLLNDRLAFITQQDIWNAIKRRQDFLGTLDTMTRRTAECIAKFGTTNNDPANKSMPWPAALALSDYTDNTRYNDVDGLLAGRVPYKVNTARGQTGNTIPSLYYLLKDDNPSGSAYCASGWGNVYPWWDNWKDHLFYAISERYRPSSSPTTACSSGHCVNVNSGGNYAAVVIFAGERLASQIRTDKSIVSAYLEGRNAANVGSAHPNGHENYQSEDASSTFNDIVYCIREDLSVVKGTATGCP